MFRLQVADDVELGVLEERHAEELFALVDRNRAYLREWMPWLDNTISAEDERSFIKRSRAQFANNEGMAAGIWFQGKLAGGIGFNRIHPVNRLTDIGYWLSADCQGKGLVTRSCRALLDYAFNELKLNRVEIYAATGNRKSRAIPERLGFVQEGILRQREWLYDHYVDIVIHSMLADEWRNHFQAASSGPARFRFQIDGETELRLLEERHAEELFAFTDQNREHLARWIRWPDMVRSVEDARGLTKRRLERFADNRGFDAGIWSEGKLAGSIGFEINWTDHFAGIGYGLGASYQGRGLMTRACRAIVDYILNELKLNRAEIAVATDNTRSRAIPERLGFTQEGIFRQAWRHNQYLDMVVYSMLASEWQAKRLPQ
jgi:ribosomal-protein-serine acetyltransferase